MSASAGAIGAGGGSGAAAPARTSGGGMSFGEVLSCLNPLQYVPVVGMIYRAVTGDTIPDGVREVGSLVFSGLTSGPVGIGISLGVGAAERLVGFDEEKFGQKVLASIGVGHSGEGGTKAAGGGSEVAAAFASGAFKSGAFKSGAFSAAELAPYAGQGLTESDALNAAELGRVATAAYARAGGLVAA